MENKNTFIAIVLMGVVWLGFTFLFPATQKTQVPGTQEAVVEQKSGPAAIDNGIKVESAANSGFSGSIPIDKELVTDAEEQSVSVDTDFYTAIFSTSGARLKSFELKKYRVTVDPDSAPVALQVAGSPRDSTLWTSGSEHLQIPQNASFQLVSGQLENRLQFGEQAQLVFRYQDANSGLIYDKVFKFNGDTYTFDLSVKVQNGSDQVRTGTLVTSLVRAWDESMKGSSYDFVGPATLVGEDLDTNNVDDLDKEIKSYKNPTWSAFEDKYFISAAIPLNGAAEKVVIHRQENLIVNSFSSPYLNLVPGATEQFDYTLYFGPRDFEIIKQAGHQLGKAIDLGFFAPISSPLRYVLHYFYGFTGNFGVAIILLTVIIKLLFWPLTQKSYSSMNRMKTLQPEMQAIREKYKKDRERMNQEMMALYKEKRVNPVGGCLPMIVQIPVFFALYRVLMVDIALRHAPFAFWLTDLSVKDPYYITPLIMGATMFIQQKMTPTTMDPTQAKMFMLMPVVFTFLFLNFPSGLVIYWLVNNLLTIAQQYMIHRKGATA
jgi:YidC/Oxa1 family membrane protein insertase